MASIQLAQIDLGALPVEKPTSLTVNLSFSGDSEWITGVDSSCSCLAIDAFPDTIKEGDNYFDITFVPNGSGPAEVSLTIYGLDVKSGEQLSYEVPFAVVGISAPEPVQLETSVQTIDPETLHSRLDHYILIDVRGSSEYKKAHIPGSFEYTLDALVALSDKFKKPLVLVGDGLLSNRESVLIEKVGERNESPLFWLEGGLPAWMRAGLPVQGTWPSPVNASTLSLRRWLETGGPSSDWEIVDLTGNAHRQDVFFGHAVHLYEPGSDLGSFLLNVQEDAMRSPNSRGLLVIGDARELAYPGIEHNDAVTHALPVYYLNQGHVAVSGWLAAARNVHDSGVKSYVYSSRDNGFSAPAGGSNLRTGKRSGCRSCPKR